MKFTLRKKTPENPAVYQRAWSQVEDELKLLDLRIYALMVKQRIAQGEQQFDAFKGLLLQEHAAFDLLDQPRLSKINNQETTALAEQIEIARQAVLNRRAVSARAGVPLPLDRVAVRFALDSFDEHCLMLALAVELDRRYEKLYGFLQDDVTAKAPTLDLALQLYTDDEDEMRLLLAAWSRPGHDAETLFRPETGGSRPLRNRVLRLEPQVLQFLLNPDCGDGLGPGLIIWMNPEPTREVYVWGQEPVDQLQAVLNWYRSDAYPAGRHLIVNCTGPDGTGRKQAIRNCLAQEGRPLLLADLRRLSDAGQDLAALVRVMTLEARLRDAALIFNHFEAAPMRESGENVPGQLKENVDLMPVFLNAVPAMPGPVFVLSERPWKNTEPAPDCMVISVDFPLPDDQERESLWRTFSQGLLFETEPDWGAMAGKFRFSPGQIRRALRTADHAAAARGRGMVGMNELHQACYAQGQHHLERKAVRIIPKYGWDDLVVPPDVKELLMNAVNQMKYRHIVYGQWGLDRKLAYGKGLSIMFSGPPGTGKTMAAQVVAHDLGLELYRIDLSQIISKYIGETEKNLHEIFEQARTSSAILFFDEADAVFGKRSEVKDAHDRYANIETAYLLQKMEEYDGMSILATNFAKNVDDAFLRRLNMIVDFPFPTPAYRKLIWRSMFPDQMPLSSDIDFDFLANRFELSGGNIKNAVISGAFLAAQDHSLVAMSHLLRAIRYELQKDGKVFRKEMFGEYGGDF